jgi:hypothetical protein|tara:strand:+ start:122 stop:316 length:195 start_codon:yes stop_codon:yes gene_type:complete
MPDIQVGDLVVFNLPSPEQQLLIDTLGIEHGKGVWLVVESKASILTLQQGNTKDYCTARQLRKV